MQIHVHNLLEMLSPFGNKSEKKILKCLLIHFYSECSILTLVLLNLDMSCLCKQCRSRSELKIRSGLGILIYSAGQGLNKQS